MRVLCIILLLSAACNVLLGQSKQALFEWKALYSESLKECDLGHLESANKLVDSFLHNRLEKSILVVKGLILKAEILCKQEKYDESKFFFDESLEISKDLPSLSSNFGIGITNIALGKLYIQKGEYEAASTTLEDALLYRWEDYDDRMIIINLQIDAYMGMNDYQSAAERVEQGFLFSRNDQELASFFEVKGVLDQKGYSIDLLAINKERKPNKETLDSDLFFKILGYFSLFLVVMIFYYNWRRRKTSTRKPPLKNLIHKDEASHTVSEPNIQNDTVDSVIVNEYDDNQDLKKRKAVVEQLKEQQLTYYRLLKSEVFLGKEIIRVTNSEATGYPVLFLKGGKKQNLKQNPNLSKIATKILKPPLFYKSSRSEIINLFEVDYEKAFVNKPFTCLKDGTEIHIPKQRWTEFQTFYMQYFQPDQ